jgi:Zn-dependent protease with chaperone function
VLGAGDAFFPGHDLPGPGLHHAPFQFLHALTEGELRDKLQALAKRAGFNVGGIFVMDGSKRSTKANAFFTGLGSKKRIALYDTLIERHDADEIEAILAHEIGHYRLGHITTGLLLSVAQTGVLLFLMGQALSLPGLFQAFGMHAMPIHAGLVFFLLLYSPISLLLTPLFAHLSRRHEFAADRFAAAHMPSPAPLVRALKNLRAKHVQSHPAPVVRLLPLQPPAPWREDHGPAQGRNARPC